MSDLTFSNLSSSPPAAEDSVASLPLSQALKHFTAASHRRLEALPALAALAEGTVSRAAYVAVLARFHAFWRDAEAVAYGLPVLATLVPDIASRHRAPLLRRDLEALSAASGDDSGMATGMAPCFPPRACLEQPIGLPADPSVGQAVGIAYVLEGSTLGGRLIAKRLGATQGLEATNGAAFFNGHGSQTGPMWRDFCICIDAWGAQASAPERQAALEGAETCFLALFEWLRHDSGS